mgnify:FL=1
MILATDMAYHEENFAKLKMVSRALQHQYRLLPSNREIVQG